MPRLSEQQINNIYLRCNAVPMAQLLELCLDPESGITVDGLRAVHYNKIDQLEQKYNAQAEEIIWAKSQSSIEALTSFIEKCQQGIFSTAHLAQAKDKRKELAAAVEEDDWKNAKYSHNSAMINGFIQKCNIGVYTSLHLAEAKELLEKVQQIEEEQTRVDWIDARQDNTILAYVHFLEVHPYCEYREEAEEKIQNMKGDLLADMRCYPLKYRRETVFEYINSGVLTKDDLVNDGNLLTEKAYNHIIKFPRLKDEQRYLPLSNIEHPQSKNGNLDVIFFGAKGVGKRMLLGGLLSLCGQFGFKFNPRCQSGYYAMELICYIRSEQLPPSSDSNYIELIDSSMNDENDIERGVSLIEMSNEKLSQFYSMDNPVSFEELGYGASGLLNNDNKKMIFLVIEDMNQSKSCYYDDEEQKLVNIRHNYLMDKLVSFLSKNSSFMKKVISIHVILTKSDTLGDYIDADLIQNLLIEQGYSTFLKYLKSVCQKFDINKSTGYQIGLYPFHVGKFMPGDVYEFDETDSLKILRLIQKHIEYPPYIPTWKDKLIKWFNK